MTKYRVCQLDDCDVWCVQRLHAPKWWCRWWVAPRWIQTRRYSIVDPLYSQPEEFSSREDAVEQMAKLERWEREAHARDGKVWRCAE